MDKSKLKYVLTGLRMYGDMLAECIEDPAMKRDGNQFNLQGFLEDLEEVEVLIQNVEMSIAADE